MVEIPTDSLGLKNALSFTVELNLSNGLGIEILKESGKKETAVPTVCDIPAIPLSILKIFSFLNMPRTFKVSVPIPILLPTDICSGIGST